MTAIYLDHNATTPLDPEVRAVMVEALERDFGNASSLHQIGQQARRLVERARSQVAALIGAEPDEIVFTSGGTEADNLAVLGAIEAAPAERAAVVVSAIEHQAVLAPCTYLQGQGRAVAFAPVDSEGRIDREALGQLLGSHVALVSLMLANNDTGVIQPVADVAAMVRAAGGLLHSDAVQAAGKLPIDVRALGVALLSISSHKLHGPKGAGALYVRRGVRLAARIHGGRQERVLRPGTENVPALVGFGKACALARARLVEDARRMQALRDRFEREVLARVPGTTVNGSGERLSNTSSLSFAGIDGEALTVNLDLLGVAASRGAACSAGDDKPSHVLVAMGQSDAEARRAVRFSFGRTHDEDEVAAAVERVAEAVSRLRGGRA